MWFFDDQVKIQVLKFPRQRLKRKIEEIPSTDNKYDFPKFIKENKFVTSRKSESRLTPVDNLLKDDQPSKIDWPFMFLMDTAIYT